LGLPNYPLNGNIMLSNPKTQQGNRLTPKAIVIFFSPTGPYYSDRQDERMSSLLSHRARMMPLFIGKS
jgi:hypothetical protein